MRETDYRVFNLWTAAGLLKYRQTKATEAALTLANELLNYKASHAFTYLRETERMMGLLRDDQVNASDVLHRVCLHAAYATANPGRFSGGTNVESVALGRSIMRLCPLQRRGRRYNSRALRNIGEIVMEGGLYMFAIRLIDRLKRDDEAARALKDAALDLDTPAVVPADGPRAGVGFRRRRGVAAP